jgi:hypothetical protein
VGTTMMNKKRGSGQHEAIQRATNEEERERGKRR